MYPALTEAEVMEKLNTIPVFGITDKEGNSVAVKTPDGATVNWVFLQKDVAAQLVEAFEQQGKLQDPLGEGVGALQVSDVPLGMIWKALAKPSDGNNVTMDGKAVGSDGETVSVQLRLMADPADLQVARNMSARMELDPAAAAASDTAEAKHAAKVKQLGEEWGVVPVFTMAGMKIRVKNGTSAEPLELRPWFLSIAGCVESFKKASAGATGGDDAAMQEALEGASLHMATLDELVQSMMKESPVDFRSIIFMPSESSIVHMRAKVEGLMKAMNEAKAPGDAAAGAPAPAAGKGGLFDEESDDENDSPFKK